MNTTVTRWQLSDSALNAMYYFADLARDLTWREKPLRRTVQSLHAKGLVDGEDIITSRLTATGRDVLGDYAEEHCRWILPWAEVQRRGDLPDSEIYDPSIDWKCGAPTLIYATPAGLRRIDTPYCGPHVAAFRQSEPRGPRGD